MQNQLNAFLDTCLSTLPLPFDKASVKGEREQCFTPFVAISECRSWLVEMWVISQEELVSLMSSASNPFFLFLFFCLLVVFVFRRKKLRPAKKPNNNKNRQLGNHKPTFFSLFFGLKPGAGQYILYSNACYTYCLNFFFANFYPPSPFTCIFPKPLLSFSCVNCG